MTRRRDEVPKAPRAGAGKSVAITSIASARSTTTRLGGDFAGPCLLEVANPALRYPDMLDRLDDLAKALRDSIRSPSPRTQASE